MCEVKRVGKQTGPIFVGSVTWRRDYPRTITQTFLFSSVHTLSVIFFRSAEPFVSSPMVKYPDDYHEFYFNLFLEITL